MQRWRATVEARGAELEILEAPARPDPIVRSLLDLPLFDAARYVLVRDAPQLSGARRGTEGAAELASAIRLASPTTHACFLVRGTVPPASVVLTAIREAGGQVVHHPALRAGERRAWLERELQHRGLRLPRDAVDLLMRCTGGVLGVLTTELDKIAAHGGRLPMEELRKLVGDAEQLELYRVLDLLAGPTPARGAALLTALVDDGCSTQYLLTVLGGQLRDLLVVHALLIRGQPSAGVVAATLKQPTWRAERLLRQAQSVPAARAAEWLHRLQRIDVGVKAGDLDDGSAMKLFGFEAVESLSA